MAGCFLTCSFYNCKRTYNHPDALNNHLKDHHQSPALSLPGKSFLCSTIGCDGSFASMQQLMDHMRHHHKPNCFYLCESCRAKLRSYRTLLKHLQTCAKVAKSKAARAEPDPLFPGADSEPSAFYPTEGEAQQMESEPSTPPQAPQAPQAPAPESAAAKPPNHPEAPYSPFPPSLSPAPDPDPQRLPRVGPLAVGTPSPQTLPGSNAVWRKNQGQSFNSRILWEHTRGRYSCLQCGHSTPERKEMTAHIEGQHRSPGAKTNDTDTSSLGKTVSDCEKSSYTQL